jgi:hypothetical protein
MTEKVQQKASEVADLMKERLGVGGKDLATKLRRAGRLMPKWLKQEATYLAQTAAFAQNPKLQKRIDFDRVDAAHKSCVDFLKSVDPVDRRKGVFLNLLGSLAMIFIVVSALIISVLRWREFI